MSSETRNKPPCDVLSDATAPAHDPGNGAGPALISALSLIGDEFYDSSDACLGEVRDIMFDRNSGRASYAVLAFAGFLDLGDTLFAVPWSAFVLDLEQRRVVPDPDRESPPEF